MSRVKLDLSTLQGVVSLLFACNGVSPLKISVNKPCLQRNKMSEPFQKGGTSIKLQRVPKKCTHNVLTVLPFDKAALAFILLAPSFERISHYTQYIIFPSNFVVLSVGNRY
jgi:hypothetical protein